MTNRAWIATAVTFVAAMAAMALVQVVSEPAADRSERRPASPVRPATGSSSPSGDTVTDYLEPIDDLLGADEHPGGMRDSDLPATLLITTVAQQPVYSTALVAMEPDALRVVAVGDRLADATVGRIERGRVVLVRDTAPPEVLRLGHRSGKAAAKRVEPPRPAGKLDWSEGITHLDETHTEVTRDAIERAMANLDALAKGARVAADFKDGQLRGYRIFRIRNDSAPRHLQLRNNDVITGVNGMPVDPATLLDQVDNLLEEPAIRLEVIRDGQPVLLDYTILP